MQNIARGGSGRLRNFRSMGDTKLFSLWRRRSEYSNDTEALVRIKAEVDARNKARVGSDHDSVLAQSDVNFDSKRAVAKSKAVNTTEMKPEIMKAARYKGKKDYQGWWMSEKYDGFRAIWDGEKFISKNGNVFYAPKEFTKGFPKVRLDGELWAGREKYQTAASIIRRQPKSKDYNAEDWNQLKYVVFDAPGLYATPQATKLAQDEHGSWSGGIRKYMQVSDFEGAMKLMDEWLDGTAKLPDDKWKTSGYYDLDDRTRSTLSGEPLYTTTKNLI